MQDRTTPLWLPADYVENSTPDYHVDGPFASSAIVHQPDVYAVADYLLTATQRHTVIDVGCGGARKLRGVRAARHIGIDYGQNIAWCRAHHADWGEWVEADLSDADWRRVHVPADENAVVVCANVIEHLIDPEPLLARLADAYERGAIVITSTPDRIRVHGTSHQGPPRNPASVREWALTEYSGLLRARGLPPTYTGYTLDNDRNQELKTIITIHDPRVQAALGNLAPRNPVAIVMSRNDADVIDEVVRDLLQQGCDVVFMDNWSTDRTLDIGRTIAAEFPGRIEIERFPAETPSANFDWHAALRRKEEVALRYAGRWIIHTDSDEIRRPPFTGLTLSQAMEVVRRTGCNRINFSVIDFRPVAGGDSLPILRDMKFFEYGMRPGHFVQWKAWLQGEQRVDLAESGGHEARFPGNVDFPYKFLVKHYALRSPSHARQKIFEERMPRLVAERRERGWHTHYEQFDRTSTFIWNADELSTWDERTFWQDHGLNVMTNLLQRTADGTR